MYSMVSIWYSLLNPEQEDNNKKENTIDQAYQQKDKNVPKILIFLAKSSIKNTQKKFQ